MSCQGEKNMDRYKSVGDIDFDPQKDDTNFKICDKNVSYSFQYYNDSKGFQYKGEKLAIEEKLKSLKIQGNENSNGYITVRFLVNCEGKAGLFRIQTMNFDYKEAAIDKNLEVQLLDFTKSLNGWIVKEINNKKIDYYQYITYKIEYGKVSEILP